MEGEQGAAAGAASTAAAEPEAVGAVSDSFSQLWTDVMGMLVSFRTVYRWEGQWDQSHVNISPWSLNGTLLGHCVASLVSPYHESKHRRAPRFEPPPHAYGLGVFHEEI